ncbi:uncharacterized protein LOC129322505 [Prosopis cineraria]|uniref:uncharacterized protein LOC129322505 n=1 Tax=Prosopis cineraria TaxID=364024 RepID=UPI00240F8CED|nr:uncharacterized protein LOC129322505 [Prosopis cineraria]
MGIQQHPQESLFEYWMRFLELLAKCPYLNVGKEFLIDYFHVGLQIHDRETIDAAANGSLLDLPLDDAWTLLKKLTNNNQQYSSRDARESKMDMMLKRLDDLESKQQSTDLVVQQFGNSNSISQAQGSGKLPTQPVINPKSLSAIELRSGRVLEAIPSASNHGGSKPSEVISRNSQICEGRPLSLADSRDSTCCDSKLNVHPKIVVENANGARSTLNAQEKEVKLSSNQGQDSTGTATVHPSSKANENDSSKAKEKEVLGRREPLKEYQIGDPILRDMPFPKALTRFAKKGQEEDRHDVFDILKKVEVNIPLLEMIKSMPKCAKFLKELCTNKKGFKPLATV